jgi:hypothetical protein
MGTTAAPGIGREGLSAGEDAVERAAGREVGLVEEGPEHGRDEVQRGDALLADDPGEVGCVAVALRAGDDQGGAGSERPEQLPDGDIEAERGLVEEAIGGGERIGLLHGEEAVSQGTLGVHRPLGEAGGAGGVDDVGEVLGLQRGAVDRTGGRGGEPGFQGVEAEQRGAVRGEALDEPRLREQEWNPAVLDHEREAIARILRVEGDIGGAGAEDGEDGHHHVERA